METMDKEKIRETVRERYGSIAKGGERFAGNNPCGIMLRAKRCSKANASHGVMLRARGYHRQSRSLLLRHRRFFR